LFDNFVNLYPNISSSINDIHLLVAPQSIDFIWNDSKPGSLAFKNSYLSHSHTLVLPNPPWFKNIWKPYIPLKMSLAI